MNGVSVIIKKELDRVFGDRKLVFSLFVLPIVLVIGIMYLVSTLVSNMQNDITSHESVVYVENAPQSFLNFVDANADSMNAKVETVDAKDLEEKKEGIVSGDVDLIYVFDENFDASISDYKNSEALPNITTYYNSSEDYSQQALESMGNLLNQYQQQLLVERFGSAEAITAFQVTPTELIDETKASNAVASRMAPYFISMLMFASAMGLVIDAIVGEKERGTMSSMLISPIPRQNIVMGKLSALALLSACSAAVYAVSMLISFPMMAKGFSDGSGSSLAIHFTPVQIVQLLVIMVLMILMYVSIIALVSIISKNTKEASSYVSPMYILVIVIGMISMYNTNDTTPVYMYAIPFYGNTLAMQKVISTGLSAPEFLCSIAGLVFVIVVLISLLTKAFNSEKVMFNA